MFARGGRHCTIHLVQALRVARDLHVNYVPVYDTVAAKYVDRNGPCKSRWLGYCAHSAQGARLLVNRQAVQMRT